MKMMTFHVIRGLIERWKRKHNDLFLRAIAQFSDHVRYSFWKHGIMIVRHQDTNGDSDISSDIFSWLIDIIERDNLNVSLCMSGDSIVIYNVPEWVSYRDFLLKNELIEDEPDNEVIDGSII